jgi:membrane-associated phospholipid phosphatase
MKDLEGFKDLIVYLLSISPIFLYIISAGLYFTTFNTVHLKAIAGMIGTVGSSEFLKYNVIGSLSPRPDDATDCNLFCNDGKQGNKPGMPSGHSSHVSFFSGFYAQQTNNIYAQSALAVYALMVMISRYMKHCHTIPQIISGALYGIISSIFVARYL